MAKVSLLIDGKPVFSLQVEESLTLGRSPDNDLQIFDTKISRYHCLIEKEKNEFIIRDLNSSNGTYVNGKLISVKVLSDGDEIHLGATDLRFEHMPETATKRSPSLEGNRGQTDMTVVGGSFQMRDLTDIYRADISRRDFRRILEKLSALFEIGNIINVHRDSASLLNAILEQIVKVIKADRYFLLLRDEEMGEIMPAAVYPSQEVKEFTPISKSILDQAFQKGNSILSSDALHDERFQHAQSIIVNEIHTVMCVPLRSHEKILGVIHVDSRDPDNVFTKDDLKLLTAIGINSGIAIENLRLYEDLKRLFRSTVKSLVTALEASDRYTGGHSVRVADYAKRLAECLQLPTEEIENIELAAYLHDIGKIGIPSEVLNKPGTFSTREFVSMQQHPVIGYDILSKIEGMEEIARMVRYHHERFDGTGYPDGLSETEIPLGSRIIGIADTLDAMTTDRPYRRRLNIEDAYREIARGAGSQFDPELVRGLRSCLQETYGSVIREDD